MAGSKRQFIRAVIDKIPYKVEGVLKRNECVLSVRCENPAVEIKPYDLEWAPEHVWGFNPNRSPQAYSDDSFLPGLIVERHFPFRDDHPEWKIALLHPT